MSPTTYLQNNRQLVMVDAGVKNPEILLAALASDIDVWPIAGGSDIEGTLGTALLQGYEKIHFLGHGQSGAIHLGGQLLGVEDFSRAISLAKGRKVKLPALHFWSCMTGAGSKGRNFVYHIAQACNSLVSAFTGLVGAQHLGGSWLPDVMSHTGELISVPFGSALAYPHSLQVSVLDLRYVSTQTGYDIQVWLKAGTVVDAIDLALTYEASKASYINAVSNPALANWSWLPNEVNSGHLLIGGYSLTAINNANDVLLETISFSIKPGYNGFTVGLVSGTGLYNGDTSLALSNLPNLNIVGNFAPTFTAFTASVGNGNEDSPMAISFDSLKTQSNATDSDGTVTAFVIKGVSTGTLRIGSSAATATAWDASSNNTVDASHQAYWTPAVNANGTLNAFTAVAKDNGGLESITAIQATIAVTPVNDAPTGTVIITGIATQNQVLTASNSLADVDGLGTIAYQWLATGTAISGATAATLTLGQAQVGKTITVKASYTDLLGTAESVSSLATSVVNNINHAPTGTVTITGTATQNKVLTASNSLADVDGLGTITYQWLANGTAISGATAATLTLTQAQVGKTITVQASYADVLGTAEKVTSSATTNVVNVNDLPSGSVTITGTATQNQVLTASNSLADVDGLGTIAYQWLANGTAISGATAVTLTLAQAQVGKAITVQAAYRDVLGTPEKVTSSATANVVNVNDLPTGTVTITGTATQNKVLTASNTLADVDGLGTITYQWFANGTAIRGATSATLTLAQAQVGKAITVQASYTDVLGTPEKLISSATTSVINVNALPTSIAKQYQKLKVANALADVDGLGTIAYQWLANGTGKAIANVTVIDTTPPTITSFSPADGISNAALASNIVLTFSETIQKGTGLIQLHSGSATGTVIESFDAASSHRLALSDNTLTIDPTNNLAYNSHFFLTFASGSVKDLAANNYAGISNYDFTTIAATSSPSSINDIVAVGRSPDNSTLLIKFTSGELIVVPSSQGGAVTLGNTTYTTADITQHTAPQAVYTSLGNNEKSYVLPELYTGPASLHLKYQLIDSSANAVIIGSTDNDFIKLGGTGNKAVSGGGGTGSTYISGGGTTDNSNTCFWDGRAPGTSWSTITDFHLNHDYATIWGWLAGVSKVDTLFTDVDTGGASSYTGLTLHFNTLLPDGSSSSATNAKLNSITLSGHSLAEFGASSLVDLNKQIANGTNTHFIIGQTHDSLGDHGYLWIH